MWKGCLVHDLEDFDFLHSEPLRIREKSCPGQAGVVRVREAKISGTVGISVAVPGNPDVIKGWTPRGMTPDCKVLLFCLQRKFSRWEVVRILQREKKTLQTQIALVPVA
jgi:hypothetical protein